MPEKEDDEWLTVAEAAKRLGLSDRQVRRDATRLSEHDRTKSDIGPVRIKLQALAFLRGMSIPVQPTLDIPGHGTPTVSDSDWQSPPMSDTVQNGLDELRGQLFEAEKRAAVAEARAEVLQGEGTRLNSALERAQTLHLGTMTELQAVRERVRELEGQNAKLIEALPVLEENAEGDSVEMVGEMQKSPSIWSRLFKRK